MKIERKIVDDVGKKSLCLTRKILGVVVDSIAHPACKCLGILSDLHELEHIAHI